MTEHVAPREDQLQLPTGWGARLLSRRGRRTGKPVEFDPEAAVELQRKVEGRAPKVRLALERAENAAYVGAAEAFIAGEPDPQGAAVVAALMCEEWVRTHSSWLRPELDAWTALHGLPFAVAAAVERLAFHHEASGNGNGYDNRVLVPNRFDYMSMHVHEYHQGGIAAVRSLTADLADDAYAEVVAAAAAVRDTPLKRINAALLLPDETAWVDEAMPEYARLRSHGWTDPLIVQSLSSPAQFDAAGIGMLSDYHLDARSLAGILEAVGPAALPMLTAAADSTDAYSTETRKLIYKAIAALPADQAMHYLVKHLGRPHVFEPATEAAERFPLRALRTVLEHADGTTGDARFRLIALAAAVPQAHRARLTGPERDAVESLLAEHGRASEADPADLPPLLVRPPWTRKRAKARPVVIHGLVPPEDVRLLWAEGEQDEWAALTDPYAHHYEYYWKELQDPAAEIAPDNWGIESFLAYGDPAQAERYLDGWLARGYAGSELTLLRILARYGERVIDRALASAAKDGTFLLLPGPILSLGAARLAAERLDRLKSARISTAQWFARHGLAAVPYLVPDALGAERKRRQYAETALLHLALHRGAEAVAAQSEPYGPEAAAAVAELLAGDLLEPRGAKLPKPGPWASPALLPQVLLEGGERALPAESVRHLLTVLALATPEYPYPGLDVVADACDRASLARFSRALFQLWLSVGAPAKDAWALTQLAHFAEDETVWMLAPLIREWPGQSQHKRAVSGLGVLGAIGSEEALRAIRVIADRVKFKALKEEAGQQITRIAASLGLNREQLADRLVPDFGLGEEAALVLDYGPRKFTVAFDEALKPFVTDEDGKPRKTLPKPGAKDDPELAGDAYQRFTALKKELRTVAADQIARLEAAMASGRAWTREEFHRFFVEHALTRHLARRLVWTVESGGSRSGFRIAEDGTFSDVEDDTVDLPADAVVRVAHPVHLGDQVDAWAVLFADHEILQPFEQLARPVLAFTADELATGRLARFEGATVETGRILGLTKRGWRRAAPEGGGVEPGIAFPLPGGGFVTAALKPGIWVGDVGEAPKQTLTSVQLTDAERYWWSDQDPPNRPFPKQTDEITAAEVLGSLARLTDRS
ncbi:DUF4132 domain-containing protein [Glycomyces sp. TRM65418]|uniref:DUF4132 domain-containing protein n=1 Tax=Glycomyces sp. TRM65418 TaxID=2867006 RepID=UPI001CE4D24A|nr:DUF4132 domain-containing protein [Glycomyces sp. TRM65418]MCC3761577.1 DUF4132 domain-containing protein [Glycomyces sp. TRM65418]QZD55672.1 DUF4132 domain-containing protein [Glycomyces sp. TRM65418]